jgi:hypothetical protein
LKLSYLTCLLCACAMAGPIPVATYQFNNNTTADQGGVPALSQVLNGSASSAYVTDTVFGHSRTVLELTGSGGNNAGLSYSNAGPTLPTTTYAVELLFEFTNPSGWRKIIDVSNRASDAGFYVDPANNLDIFPVAGLQPWTSNVYHQVVMSVNSGTVSVYLDNTLALSASTAVMNLPGGNPLNFFLDDFATSTNEFSSSRVALINLFDTPLSASDVAGLFGNGDPLGSATPEPGSWALLCGGLILIVRRKLG